MTYKELQKISELRKYTYEDYMCNQAMRDGEEIRIFLDSLEEETDRFGGDEMKKFRDENGNIITEDELEKEFNKLKRSGDTEANTFAEYKRNCLEKNGSLEEIAPEFDIENRRRWTATKIAAQSDMKYGNILNVLQKYNVHGNWTPWEINNRPVDYDELTEMVEQELRR